MFVTFVLASGKEIPVHISQVLASEYINDCIVIHNCMNDRLNNQITNEVHSGIISCDNNNGIYVDVPEKYTSVIDVYLSFPNINVNWNVNWNVQTLLLCFDMETYFIDDKFFKYLMSKAYTMWKEFYTRIQKLNNRIDYLRTIYLHSPYEFVPYVHISNPTFFSEWLTINQNININFKPSKLQSLLHNNDSDIYTTQCTYHDNGKINSLHIYHTVNNKKTGYEMKQCWYDNGQCANITNYVDGILHGIVLRWYDNGNLEHKLNYDKGQLYGLEVTWYYDGKIKSMKHYVNGKKHGTCTNRYENGKIHNQIQYVNGKRHGTHIIWYDTGHVYAIYKYKRGYYTQSYIINDTQPGLQPLVQPNIQIHVYDIP